jgi:ketosteroid isomerase-like protein
MASRRETVARAARGVNACPRRTTPWHHRVMHPHARVIQTFYDAFGRRDAEGMIGCYTPDVTFSDAVFVGLGPREARGMWRMLAARAKDLRLEASGIDADDTSGRAHWEAWYTFSATGRAVHNVIDATFTFRDGKIAQHRDAFDPWRWARQALGVPGLVLGAPGARALIRRNARKGLDAYLRDNPTAGDPV